MLRIDDIHAFGVMNDSNPCRHRLGFSFCLFLLDLRRNATGQARGTRVLIFRATLQNIVTWFKGKSFCDLSVPSREPPPHPPVTA